MVVDGKVDLDSGVADEVGGVIVDADEGKLEDYSRWNRKYADGKEVGEISIVIEADREINRSWFPFLCSLEYDSCKSHVFLRYGFGVLVMFGYVSLDQGINIDWRAM